MAGRLPAGIEGAAAAHDDAVLEHPAAALSRAFEILAVASDTGFSIPGADGVVAYATGAPLGRMNGIAIDRGTVAPGTVRLDEMEERLAASRLPWTLQWFGEGSEPVVALGGSPLTSTGVVVPTYSTSLDRILSTGRPNDLRIEEVRTDEDRADFSNVLGAAFGSDASLGEPLVHPSTLAGDGVEAFVGRVRGEPVATGMIVVDGPWCGIFAIATAAEHRSRGHAEAMTTHLARVGHEMGAVGAYLQASDMGLPLYRRLGFEDAGDDITYVSIAG